MSNSSSVLVTGKAATFIRALALDRSREVISASISVRRNSSGFQRWVLAVTNSSGESCPDGRQPQPTEPGLQVRGQSGGVVVMTHPPMA